LQLLDDIQLSRIFVHAIPKRRAKHSLLWTGTEVNKAIQQYASDIRIILTGGLLRKLNTIMFAEHYPEIYGESNNSPNPVDDQGQHTRNVRERHYEQVLNIPPALNMTINRARQYMSISQISQSLYSLACIGEGWDDIIEASPIFSRARHGQIALLTARYLICAAYGINGANAQDSVERILKSRPYLGSEDVSIL
jgi:hypothetical protein